MPIIYGHNPQTGDCGWLDEDTGEVGWFGGRLVDLIRRGAPQVGAIAAKLPPAELYRRPYKRGTETDPYGYVTPEIAAAERLTPLEQASILAEKYNVGLRLATSAISKQPYKRGTSSDPLGYLNPEIIAQNRLTPGEVTSIHEAQFKADHPEQYGIYKAYLVQRHHEVTSGGVLKSLGSALTSVAKVATAPVKAASDIAHGKNVLKSVSTMVKSSLPPKSVLAAVGKYAGSVPGLGTVVGAGANAFSAALSGKSLAQIASATAMGAIPGGPLVQNAVRAAGNIAVAGVKGQNIARAARDEVIKAAVGLAPPAVQGVLDGTVRAALSGGNVLSAAQRSVVASALNQIPNDQARQMLAGVVKGQTSPEQILSAASGQQLGAIISQNPGGQLARLMSAAQPSPGASAMFNNFRLNPSPAIARPVAVRGLGASRPSFTSHSVTVNRPGVQHRALSDRAKYFVATRTGREVGGLVADGTWKVTAGDTGSKIALALTGNANRWTELKTVNPKIMSRPAADIQKYGFPIYVGDTVHLPATWVKVTPSPVPSVANNPVVAPLGDIAAMGAARLQLVAWQQTDGANQAGSQDYGTPSDLASPAWSSRDKLQAAAFGQWWNHQGLSPMSTSGELTQELAGNLAKWTEATAKKTIPSAPAPSAQPTTPTTPSPAAQQQPSVPSPSPAAAAPNIANFPQALAILMNGLQSTDAANLRVLAGQLRDMGYPDLATQLETRAASLPSNAPPATRDPTHTS